MKGVLRENTSLPTLLLLVLLLLVAVAMATLDTEDAGGNDELLSELKRSPMLRTQDARNFFARLRK